MNCVFGKHNTSIYILKYCYKNTFRNKTFLRLISKKVLTYLVDQKLNRYFDLYKHHQSQGCDKGAMTFLQKIYTLVNAAI